MQSRVVVVVGSLLSACGGAPANSTAVTSGADEIGCFQEFGQDAPGKIAAAVPMGGDEVTGCLGDSNRDPADALRLEMPDGDVRDALHRIEVQPSDSLSLCVSLVGAADQELHRVCGQKPGEKIELWAVAVLEKPVKLKLEPAQNLDRTESYTVRSAYEIIDDPDEPNEYLEDATPLTLGEEHQAYFASSSGAAPVELDLYRVDVKKGALQFAITNVPTEISFMVEVLDESGQLVRRFVSKDKGADLSESVELDDGGTYILRLSNALGKIVPRKAGQGALPSYLKGKYSVTATWEE